MYSGRDRTRLPHLPIVAPSPLAAHFPLQTARGRRWPGHSGRTTTAASGGWSGPSATIATAGFSQEPNVGEGYTSGWEWANDVLGAYETAYSTAMPIDVWNFHMYNTDRYNYEVITVEQDIEEWIDFIETTRGGIYSTT